ncbi:MAG: MFS transporter [Chloroflexi bacterium]|nr:MFS transporter [Chloroflexota bacterium]
MRSRGFVVLWFALFVAMIGISMVSPLLPVFVREELFAPEFAVALSFSGVAITEILVSPFAGRLGDRLGNKRPIVVGLLIFAVTAISYGLIDRWELILVVRILSGVGGAIVFTLAMAYVARLAPAGQEGTYIGVFTVAMMSGFGVGPILGGGIRDAWSTDAAFIGMAILASAAALAVFVFLPNERASSEARASSEDAAPTASMWQVVRRRHVRAGVLAGVLSWVGWGAAGTYLGVYVLGDDGLGLESALFVGLLLGIRSILTSVVQPVAGVAADRWSRTGLVVGGLLLAGVVQFAIPDLPRSNVELSVFGGEMTVVPWLLAAIVVIGIGEAFVFPAQQAILVNVGREVGMGAVMGLNVSAGGLGFLAGSMFAAAAVAGFGIDSVFRASGGLIVVGAVVFWAMMRAPATPAPPEQPAPTQSAAASAV